MRKVKTLVLILLLIVGVSRSVYPQSTNAGKDTTSRKLSYLKFSAFPFLFASLFKNEAAWVTLHYETQIKSEGKLTCNAVLDYRNYTYKLLLNGITVSRIPDNINFYVRPQIRFYTGKKTFKGYYVGAFPLYLYRNIPSSSLKGHYWGAGFVTGYQVFVHKKYPLEINTWIAGQTAIISTVDILGQPVQERNTFAFLFFELNLGLPTKRSR